MQVMSLIMLYVASHTQVTQYVVVKSMMWYFNVNSSHLHNYFFQANRKVKKVLRQYCACLKQYSKNDAQNTSSYVQCILTYPIHGVLEGLSQVQ
jgi:hypothetical protein